MQKNTFVTTSMVAAISQAASIRENITTTTTDLLDGLTMTQTESYGWGTAQIDALQDKSGRSDQTNQWGNAQTKATSFSFAETEQSEEHFHKCSTAMDRNKNTLDDYTAILAMNDVKYEDPNFPIEDALWWLDAGEQYGDMDSLD